MTSPLVDNLRALAAQLEEAGQPLLAIKCLTVCLQESPVVTDEIVISMHLARLLMERCTDSLTQAKQKLLHANMLASKLKKDWLLKCEVMALLGRAHEYAAEYQLQYQVYKSGLQVCEQGLKAANAADVSLGRCSVMQEAAPAVALDVLEKGRAFAEAQSLGLHEVLIRLAQMQLWVGSWTPGPIAAALEDINSCFARLDESGVPPTQLTQLRLHFGMLQVLYALRAGEFQQLAGSEAATTTASLACIEELELLLQQLKGYSDVQQPRYEWHSHAVLEASLQLMAASLLRPGGKIKAALEAVVAGLALLQSELDALRLPRGVREEQLDYLLVRRVRPLLALQLLLRDCKAHLHLQRTEYALAREETAASINTLQAFPHLLASLQPVVHIQAGLYAQAMGSHHAAIAHLQRAGQTARGCPLANMVVKCHQALCWLSSDSPDAAENAMALLGPLAAGEPPADLGFGERSLLQLSKGLLRLRQGQSLRAKQTLLKVLKLAHGRIQNHQMVSATLVYVAPLLLSYNDKDGAIQMVQSSFMLAKNMGDLSGQVAGLQVLQALGSSQDVAAEGHNYLLKKQDELTGRIHSAEADTQQQHLILQWDLTDK